MDPLGFSNPTFQFTQNDSPHTCQGRNPNEETQVLETLKSLLNLLTQGNYNNLKSQLADIQFSDRNLKAFLRILETSLENNGDNLFATLEKALEELVLLQKETYEETQKFAHKVPELEMKYNDEIRLRKETEDALVRKNDEINALNQLFDSQKEEMEIIQLQAEALAGKHEDELRLRKETEVTVAIEREINEKVKLQLQTMEHEHVLMRANAKELESKYKSEMILRKESEVEVDKERRELQTMKQRLETCGIEKENLRFEAKTWQNRYGEELRLRKTIGDGLVKVKDDLMMAQGLVISCKEEAAAIRQKRKKVLVEIKRKRIEQLHQTPLSFICPITREIMKDPHVAEDGFTYEAEAIRKWFSIRNNTSPLTNLKLSTGTIIPNRALRSAIEELTSNY